MANQVRLSDEEQAHQKHFANIVGSERLLAHLFLHHKDHALNVFKGVQPRVIDHDDIKPMEPVPARTTAILEEDESPVHRPTGRDIVGVVCRFYNMTRTEMCSRRNHPNLVWARSVVVHLMKSYTLASYPEIGRLLGDRDHTTAMYAAKRVEKKISEDPKRASEIKVLSLQVADIVAAKKEKSEEKRAA